MAPITKKYFESSLETKGKEIENLTTGLKRAEGYLLGIAIVTALGLITLLVSVLGLFIDNLRFKASTYQVLVDKVSNIEGVLISENSLRVQEHINIIELRSELERVEDALNDLKLKNSYLK